LTLPGIGRILGLTITMEVGDVKRFATDGDFASYCRMVDAKRLSNGKRKADNNAKCGNAYLSWAFIEASNFARRNDAHCQRWYDRKLAKTSNIIATKALGCKLAKAAWHVMREGVAFDWARAFPGGVPGGEPERQVRAAGAPKTAPPPHRPAPEKDPTSLTPLGSVSSRVSPGRGGDRTTPPADKTRSKTKAKRPKAAASTESRTTTMKKRT
jgi:hypothetical protein